MKLNDSNKKAPPKKRKNLNFKTNVGFGYTELRQMSTGDLVNLRESITQYLDANKKTENANFGRLYKRIIKMLNYRYNCKIRIPFDVVFDDRVSQLNRNVDKCFSRIDIPSFLNDKVDQHADGKVYIEADNSASYISDSRTTGTNKSRECLRSAIMTVESCFQESPQENGISNNSPKVPFDDKTYESNELFANNIFATDFMLYDTTPSGTNSYFNIDFNNT
jgi:hypothetical protein